MGSELVGLLSADKGNEVVAVSRHANATTRQNLRYMRGDAFEPSFIGKLLRGNFDVVVDFMWHDEESISRLLPLFLRSAGQYFFLSSAAVYADSDTPLKEDSPRFIDLASSSERHSAEYHIAKARAEDVVVRANSGNWTVIRPHVVYNGSRLPLCTWEKGVWLPLSIRGIPIATPEDVLQKKTTLTHGREIARQICTLAGKKDALGEVFNVGSEDVHTWGELFDIYDALIHEATGHRIAKHKSSADEISRHIPTMKSRFSNDRLLDRRFDLSKYKAVSRADTGDGRPLRESISECVRLALASKKAQTAKIADFDALAGNGRITGIKPSPSLFTGRDKASSILRSIGIPDRITTCVVEPEKAFCLAISMARRMLKKARCPP